LPIPWFAAWEFEHSGQAFHIVLSGQGGWALRLGPADPFAVPSGAAGVTDWLLGRESQDQRPLDFGVALQAMKQPVSFHVPSLTGSGPIPDSLRELARALGAPDYQNRTFGFDQLMSAILQRGIVLTDNRKTAAGSAVTVDSLGQAADMRDGSNVAVELYRLRNGDVRQQERYEQITATFADLTRRTPKCSIGASAFGRPWGRP